MQVVAATAGQVVVVNRSKLPVALNLLLELVADGTHFFPLQCTTMKKST